MEYDLYLGDGVNASWSREVREGEEYGTNGETSTGLS